MAAWDQPVYGLAASPSPLGVNSPADLPAGPPYQLRPALPIAGWPTLLRHPFADNVTTVVQEY